MLLAEWLICMQDCLGNQKHADLMSEVFCKGVSDGYRGRQAKQQQQASNKSRNVKAESLKLTHITFTLNS